VITVEQIVLNVDMPTDKVHIVTMQPFIRFHSESDEPFHWSDDAVGDQLEAIGRTLDIAQEGLEGKITNFTLFPEYAIPGIAGITLIDERISAVEWPNGSIIIAGIHGVCKTEYIEICENAQVSNSNAPDSVPNDQWVNCCVIWVKNLTGELQKYIQPKIRPAWSEMNVTCNDMFCGSAIYVFECQYERNNYPCRFVTFICFDWVASVAGKTVCQELLELLNQQWVDSQPALDWVFVIQHNKKPNHNTFLNSTINFLTDVAYPFIQREKAMVLHANTAISEHPARVGSGGFSACVFSPSAQFDINCCRPTVCTQPKVLRGSDILGLCKDVVFREMGECIHVFSVRIPRFVTPNPTDRTYPLPSAQVHAIRETSDPRLSNSSIPAAIKWVNDSLDNLELISTALLNGCSLKQAAISIEPLVLDSLRKSDGQYVAKSLDLATCSISSGSESQDNKRHLNADLWGNNETEALEHVFYSLASIGIAHDLAFDSGSLHGSIETDGGFIRIVAIRGKTHEDCRQHYDSYIMNQGTDPVLVITRDRYNIQPLPEEFMKIDETNHEKGLSFLDFSTLVANCRSANDTEILKESIDEFLPKDCRII
jgi:hypothetical protein